MATKIHSGGRPVIRAASISSTGLNDVLRYGAVGHIFLGWIPLAWQ
ncbi:hypothetical protein [Streptomyces albireticuli]|nr:hypothetical protein [Streptomyces albireticuli]MCD9146040.1 hypothetical protein [Streptomyces albireticuli]MCD9166195.1 hypothetical protein [Streptomyces albireticuli]MCD9196512.1 hypothetical protein [Streptomyces albireticuli]